MPRIILEEQQSYDFKHAMEIRASDVNMGGHLGHSELVNYIHEARARFLESIGARERDLGDGFTGIVIGDLAVNYLSEAFWGDTLIIESTAGEIGEKSLRLFHRVMRNDITIALAETGIIAFSFTGRKSVPLPDIFLERLQAAAICP